MRRIDYFPRMASYMAPLGVLAIAVTVALVARSQPETSTETTASAKQLEVITPSQKEPSTPEYAQTHVLVAFKSSYAAAQFRPEEFGLEVDQTVDSPYFARLNISQNGWSSGVTVDNVLPYLQRHPSIRIAERDPIVTEDGHIPNDPFFWRQHGPYNTGQLGGTPGADISAPEAWTITKGQRKVIVAVIDSGVEYTHPDLTASIYRRKKDNSVIGYDFVNNDADPADDRGHGTGVAGVIGATMDNSIGIAGIAPDAKIMPLKFLNPAGFGMTSNAILCMDYAIQNGATIINNSWGGPTFNQLMLEAIQRAADKGIMVICSAGNNGLDTSVRPHYPASYNQFSENVISVANSDYRDYRRYYSNFGTHVDIVAPGTNIYTTQRWGNYGYRNGTSFAAPHITGIVALIKSKYKKLSVSGIRSRLLYSADRVSELNEAVRDNRRANAFAALKRDNKAPRAPTQLVVKSRNSNALELEWRASGDDAKTGAASYYDVRYSFEPINDTNFDAAYQTTRSPLPKNFNEPISYVISGLLPNTPAYVAVRAIDSVGNKSPIATVGPVSTMSSAYWFDDASTNQYWVGTKSWGLTNSMGRYSSDSWTDSPVGSTPVGDSFLTLKNSMLAEGPMIFSFDGFFRMQASTSTDEDAHSLSVQVSRDNGLTWMNIATYTGTMGWKHYSLFIPSVAGEPVKVRFHIRSNSSDLDDGVYLDNLRFTPAVVSYEDDMESVTFTGPKPWTRTNLDAVSPSHSWTDSPNNKYQSSINISLRSLNAIERPQAAPVVLAWMSRFEIERRRDFCFVQFSENDGVDWFHAFTKTGFRSTWSPMSADVTGTTPILLRFNLVTDVSVREDGLFFDDIKLVGEPLVPM